LAPFLHGGGSIIGNRTLQFKRPGYTLVEILAVLGIVGVLVGLTFYMFSAAQKTADNLEAQVASVTGTHKKAKARKTPNHSWVENEHIVVFKRGTQNPRAEA